MLMNWKTWYYENDRSSKATYRLNTILVKILIPNKQFLTKFIPNKTRKKNKFKTNIDAQKIQYTHTHTNGIYNDAVITITGSS